VLGLAFLRLPALVTLAVAAFVAAAPYFLRSEIFDYPALWWVGLSSVNPRSNDYVPLFPWFSAILAGLAVAKIAGRAGWLDRLGRLSLPRWSWPLQWAGRHSLAVYLIHQPVLIGSLWLFAQVAPAAEAPRYCACVLEDLAAEGRFDEVYAGTPGEETTRRLHEIVDACTFDSELAAPEEGEE
jgi:uncharacterized membrane protein